MDSNKLEAALRRLEDEQFGRTLNLSGKDAAVVGGWLRWLWDTPGIDLERMRAFANRPRGEQKESEPIRIVDAEPDGGGDMPEKQRSRRD
jgi:hypothetical protein